MTSPTEREKKDRTAIFFSIAQSICNHSVKAPVLDAYFLSFANQRNYFPIQSILETYVSVIYRAVARGDFDGLAELNPVALLEHAGRKKADLPGHVLGLPNASLAVVQRLPLEKVKQDPFEALPVLVGIGVVVGVRPSVNTRFLWKSKQYR